MPGFADFAGFAGVVEITRLNTSEFYYLDKLYGNELVFAFSFVSSNNTDVETTEQFILLHTRYVVTFLVWLTSPRNSETRRKHLYCTLFTSSVFLLLSHDEFFDAFQGKKFCLETVCLFQRLVIGQLIRKSCFLDRLFSCWLQSCELLHLRRVLNFFLCFWS